MRPRVPWWCVLVVVGGCSFDGSGLTLGPDADPNAPDADPNAPDADPNAPDASCTAAALGFAPANIDRCAIPVPMGSFTFQENVKIFIDTTTGVIVSDGVTVTDLTRAQVMQSNGTSPAMVIVATNLTVPASAEIVVSGNRPLIVVATGAMTIAGLVDASGTMNEPGPGGGSPCILGNGVNGGTQTANTNPVDLTGGAGGGGGAYGTDGGDGAYVSPVDAANMLTAGGTLTVDPMLSPLRGGCDGGRGGVATIGEGAVGGKGGGGLELIGGTSIAITGVVSVSGGGGTGATLDAGGGGGGGSGGAVLLQSPSILVDAGVVTSNGGAGGEGRRDLATNAGQDGQDGHLGDDAAAIGGSGAAGGNGGEGATGDDPGADGQTGTGAMTAVAGGGGAGGGVGRIHVRGTLLTSNGALIFPTQTTSTL